MLPFSRLLTAVLVAASASRQKPGDGHLVLAGGCFWGVEAVFEHVRGVRSVVSGFARPSDAERGFVPVEAVRILFDPARVTPRQLLDIFFHVVHDPTSRDRQGPDAGPEYRAMVFYQTAAERATTDSFIAGLARGAVFPGPIVTEVRPLGGFTMAEAFHQNYSARHETDPYVVRNDLPRIAQLRSDYPSLFQSERAP